MLKELGRLSMVMSAVRLLADDMQAQKLAIFLEVASHHPHGISRIDLEKKLGISSSTSSRNVQDLSEWSWMKKPGLGLVYDDLDPQDTRRKVTKLTKKGELFAQQLESIMNKGD